MRAVVAQIRSLRGIFYAAGAVDYSPNGTLVIATWDINGVSTFHPNYDLVKIIGDRGTDHDAQGRAAE